MFSMTIVYQIGRERSYRLTDAAENSRPDEALAAKVQARPRQHAGALRPGLLRELRHEARLAKPRVATDEHDGGLSLQCPPQRLLERRKLVRAANEM